MSLLRVMVIGRGHLLVWFSFQVIVLLCCFAQVTALPGGAAVCLVRPRPAPDPALGGTRTDESHTDSRAGGRLQLS